MTIEQIREAIRTDGLAVIIVIALALYFAPIVRKAFNLAFSRREAPPTNNKEKGMDEKYHELIKLDGELNTLLAEIAGDFVAQWVMVLQFHNGQKSVTDVPFLKVTATHEYADAGYIHRMENFKDIPVSMFYDISMKIANNEIVCVNADDDYNSSIKGLMTAGGAKSAIVGPIMSASGNVAGMLVVLFCASCLETISDLDRNRLLIGAGRVASLLEVMARLNRYIENKNKAM